MSSQEHSQPAKETSYKESSNPADSTSAEQFAGAREAAASDNTPKVDRRSAHDVESTHDNPAEPSALGSGDTGPLTEKALPKSTAETVSSSENDGEQMRAPGEGEIADAVQNKAEKGGFGEQESLTRDMDAKKAEHEEKLKKYGLLPERDPEEREDWSGAGKEVDIDAALGGRGPAVVGVGEGLD